MKVLLLSDTFSEHTEKWALGLANSGIHIGLFSFNKASYPWYDHPNITVFFEPDKTINAESILTKIGYVKYVSILKRIIKHFKPDLLHAHYATSYGLVGALSGFHPFILSVWGADVYDFPSKSKLHKRLFQYNLKRADTIMSTSHVMKGEIERYTKKNIVVTPFGVDTELFAPKQSTLRKPGCFNIGTIKPIEEKYGIVYIIEAAEILIKKRGHKDLMFYLIGKSHDEEHYRKIIHALGLDERIHLTGRIPFSEISDYHNMLDVFVNVSIDDSESFGVAAVEAMSCAKPVIVTDVGGLKEVVDNGRFGIVIPKKDPLTLANTLEELMKDQQRASDLGRSARAHVIANYDWKNNLALMISEYKKLIG